MAAHLSPVSLTAAPGIDLGAGLIFRDLGVVIAIQILDASENMTANLRSRSVNIR
jgi:hypothetical protein